MSPHMFQRLSQRHQKRQWKEILLLEKTLTPPVLPVTELMGKVTRHLIHQKLQVFRTGTSQDSSIILRSVPEVD